jgi:hypothetical protein
MADNGTPPTEPTRHPFEFWLVVVMLGVLTVLVGVVFFVRASWLGIGGDTNPELILTWRKDVLAIIITAFGAWIGAGAAYFFGRENLRVAADSLLAMRGLSGKERLRRVPIKQIPPTPIDWTVKRTTPLSEVKDALTEKPERWFVPVIKEDETLDTVVNEEGVWRFLIDKLPAADATEEEKTAYANATVEDLLKYIEETETLTRFSNIHAITSMETNVGAANDLMDSRHVFLAIVTADGKPTHFFTTSEVRKLLLKEE